jgi:hypothetical protein
VLPNATSLNKQAQIEPKLKRFKQTQPHNWQRDSQNQRGKTWLPTLYNFKDKLTRPSQGQGLNHKAKTKAKNFIIKDKAKAKDFTHVLKDRPRPRPRTNITANNLLHFIIFLAPSCVLHIAVSALMPHSSSSLRIWFASS